jgi:hypothetical protein
MLMLILAAGCAPKPKVPTTPREVAALGTRTPLPTRTPTLTPMIVTPEPRLTDVFQAVTRSVQKTAEALAQGTPTATPRNMITATFTPGPLAITNTPTPADGATADYLDRVATARAFTTGTPTPFETYVFVASETPTRTPLPTETPRPPATETPTATPTPVMVPLASLKVKGEPTPTPVPLFPPELAGKVLFMSDYTGTKRAYAMNPDGSDVEALTSLAPYQYAEDRDTYSADRNYRAYAERDKDGLVRLIQLYVWDEAFKVRRLLTNFGSGTAWAPAWHPHDDLIAFVSNESGADEIWVVRKDELPAKQLTHGTWEWNHHPSWSPDGKQIVFSSNRSGRQQIWVMNPDGSNPQPLTDGSFNAWDPIWVKYAE